MNNKNLFIWLLLTSTLFPQPIGAKGLFGGFAHNIKKEGKSLGGIFGKFANEIDRSTKATQKIQANSPLSKACANTKTGSVPAATYHGQIGCQGTESWESLVSKGYFDNAFYLRMLLSEFYCARCAIGANVFNNNNLPLQISQDNWPTLSSNSNGDIYPGGIDLTVLRNFINKATSAAAQLKKVRSHLDGVKDTQASYDPLKTFAGVIIAPTAQFTKELGTVAIQSGNTSAVINEAVFFPYQQSKEAKKVLKKASMTVADSLSAVPLTSSVKTSVQSPDGNHNSDQVTIKLKGTIQLGTGNNQRNISTTLCDLQLMRYQSTVKINGNPLPFLLQSISGEVATSKIFIRVYDQFRESTKEQTALQSFFREQYHNPWALVIKIDGQKDASGGPETWGSIAGIVQLNPLAFFKYIKEPPSELELENLLKLPSDLYYSIPTITNTGNNANATPTARLLRGIANGYLTSWNYHQMVKPGDTIKPCTGKACYVATPAKTYPTPSNAEFKKYANPGNYNRPYCMLYALTGCRSALPLLHITPQSIKHILTILEDPTKSVPGYIGSSAARAPSIATTLTEKMNIYSTHHPSTTKPTVAPKKPQQEPMHHSDPSKPKKAPVIHHKPTTSAHKPTVAPAKPPKKVPVVQHKPTVAPKKPQQEPMHHSDPSKPKKAPVVQQHKISAPTHYSSKRAIQAYKNGYRQGLRAAKSESNRHHGSPYYSSKRAIQAYKNGYRDGFERVRQRNSRFNYGSRSLGGEEYE